MSILFLTLACGGQDTAPAPSTGPEPEALALSGSIAIDGSSTVYPITEAVAEEWGAQHRGVRVTIGVSGTGGGMKKFCNGEVAITGASRHIKASEVELCAAGAVDYLELPVAFDGIAVVVNTAADWVDSLTVAELDHVWRPEAQNQLDTWSQVRDGFPDQALRLYGPGVDSGTYDYFTKVIVGTEHKSRGDYTSSEDDNVIVTGVSGDVGGLGFFGLAYYQENRDRLKALGIGEAGTAVKPSQQTVGDGSYSPLSRPIFVYVNVAELERPEVAAFLTYYLEEGRPLVEDVGYVALPDAQREAALASLPRTGSASGGAQ